MEQLLAEIGILFIGVLFTAIMIYGARELQKI